MFPKIYKGIIKFMSLEKSPTYLLQEVATISNTLSIY